MPWHEMSIKQGVQLGVNNMLPSLHCCRQQQRSATSYSDCSTQCSTVTVPLKIWPYASIQMTNIQPIKTKQVD